MENFSLPLQWCGDLFIRNPLVASIPAIIFALFYVHKTSRWLLISSLLWFLYLAYEYAMKFRILCSGECNIRFDLLLVYPLVFAISIIALARYFYLLWRRTEIEGIRNLKADYLIIKKHPTHKKITDRWIICLSVAGFLSLFLIWYIDVHIGKHPEVDLSILLTIILIFSAMAISIGRTMILRCPNCHQFTRFIVKQDDSKTRCFYCSSCNIQWDSDIKVETPH